MKFTDTIVNCLHLKLKAERVRNAANITVTWQGDIAADNFQSSGSSIGQ